MGDKSYNNNNAFDGFGQVIASYPIHNFIDKQWCSFFRPDNISKLPPKLKKEISIDVSKTLKKHSKTMMQYSKKSIDSFVAGKSAYILIDNRNGNVIGFLRFIKLLTKKDKDQRDIYEIGTWFIKDHYRNDMLGQKLLTLSLIDFKHEHPNAKVIAIVHKKNKRSKHILEKIGAVKFRDKKKLILKNSNILRENYFFDLDYLRIPLTLFNPTNKITS